MHGKPMPESLTKGNSSPHSRDSRWSASVRSTRSRNRQESDDICALLPQIGSVIDDICLIRSMTTEATTTTRRTCHEHVPRSRRPAWAPGSRTAGSESENLPGFVVLMSLGARRSESACRARAVEQRASCRVAIRACTCVRKAIPVLYLSSPAGISAGAAGCRRCRPWAS